MSNALNDIAAGKVRRPLGGSSGSSDSDADATGGDFPISVSLAAGEKLIATFENAKNVASKYKDKDGNPQPDVTYYTFTVAEDTGLFHMAVNPDTGRKAEEPISVGAKVSMRAKGDLADQMREATPGMLLEIEFLGTKPTNSGFNFSLFIVSELVAE
jgi:hypothetical protein